MPKITVLAETFANENLVNEVVAEAKLQVEAASGKVTLSKRSSSKFVLGKEIKKCTRK